MSVQSLSKALADFRQDARRLTALRTDKTLSRGAVCWWVMAIAEHLHQDNLVLREIAGMPKTETKQSEWRGFVDVKLTQDEKEKFAAWDVQDGDLWVFMADSIASGHKLSLTYNKQNDQYVASFTGQQEKGSNAGLTLSAYAKDWYDAIRVLVFKHAVLLEADWSRAKDRPGDDIG